jgi:predicted nicotinamide N-methyase
MAFNPERKQRIINWHYQGCASAIYDAEKHDKLLPSMSPTVNKCGAIVFIDENGARNFHPQDMQIIDRAKNPDELVAALIQSDKRFAAVKKAEDL